MSKYFAVLNLVETLIEPLLEFNSATHIYTISNSVEIIDYLDTHMLGTYLYTVILPVCHEFRNRIGNAEML